VFQDEHLKEFLEYAKKLEGKDIDILLIHETPYLPELFPFMRDDFASRTALEAVKIVKPKIVFNGHMHSGGFKMYRFGFGVKNIYIDSSQVSRHYIVLYTKEMRLEIWRDHDVVDMVEV